MSVVSSVPNEVSKTNEVDESKTQQDASSINETFEGPSEEVLHGVSLSTVYTWAESDQASLHSEITVLAEAGVTEDEEHPGEAKQERASVEMADQVSSQQEFEETDGSRGSVQIADIAAQGSIPSPSEKDVPTEVSEKDERQERVAGGIESRRSGSLDTTFYLLGDEDEEDDQEPTRYITVEETVMDDLGKELKVKQKIPIIQESHRFERVTVAGGTTEEGKTHKFFETITRVIKKSEMNEDGEMEERETKLTEVVEHMRRPSDARTVYAKRINEKGEVEEVVVPAEEQVDLISHSVHEEKKKEPKKKSVQEKQAPGKKRTLKFVKTIEVEPCSFGKVHEVLKPTVVEVDLPQQESELEESASDEEELDEEEMAQMNELVLKRREAKISRLKDKLRTLLVRLALAEKKRNLYMQLISISAEVKEDILNPPEADKPTFKVPKKAKAEDKFRRLYTDKLMEYRELRSVILVKLAMEKKRKQEVKRKYDLIASEVANLGSSLRDKLTSALSRLLPKHDPVFKNQSPSAMVKRVLELMERLDNETKELMYKKKQMYLAKQKYDALTENEQGLSYKYALASKELKELVGKNDRRNEKLESLKTTMQKECLAVTHINQKCEAILRTTDEKNMKLRQLNRSLNRARQDRKDVHQARRKVEAELRQENARIKLINRPSLVKEYRLVQDLLRAKQAEFQQLKRDCTSSLEHVKKSPGDGFRPRSLRSEERR